jgi:hypothetical protein
MSDPLFSTKNGVMGSSRIVFVRQFASFRGCDAEDETISSNASPRIIIGGPHWEEIYVTTAAVRFPSNSLPSLVETNNADNIDPMLDGYLCFYSQSATTVVTFLLIRVTSHPLDCQW